MSKRTNTTMIGAFIFGAMVAAVAAMAYLGAFKWASKERTFVFFFAESVTSLEIGAKVKFQGVNVGSVKAIRIAHMHENDDGELVRNQIEEITVYDSEGRMQKRDINLIPVYATIDLAEVSRIDVLGDNADMDDMDKLASMIHNKGLRAQLQLDSIITGLKYIELNYFSEEELANKYEKDTHKPIYGQIHGDYPEIPTVPSLSKSAEELFGNFSKVDFEAINDNLQDTLASFQRLADSLEGKISETDIAGTAQSINEAAQAIRAQIGGLNLAKTVEEAEATMAEVQKLTASINKRVEELLGEPGPVISALKAVDGAASRVDEALAPEASLRYETEKALSNLASSARSLKEFIDYLERNPSALITGRPPPSTE